MNAKRLSQNSPMNTMASWVSSHLKKDYPGVEVKNLTTSFQSGQVFCALLHHFAPEKLPEFPELKFTKENAKDNNELAFVRFAELGIDKLLDGEDIAEVPDQKSIYTYLTTILARFDGDAGSVRTPSGLAPVAVGGSRLSQNPTGPKQTVNLGDDIPEWKKKLQIRKSGVPEGAKSAPASPAPHDAELVPAPIAMVVTPEPSPEVAVEAGSAPEPEKPQVPTVVAHALAPKRAPLHERRMSASELLRQQKSIQVSGKAPSVEAATVEPIPQIATPEPEPEPSQVKAPEINISPEPAQQPAADAERAAALENARAKLAALEARKKEIAQQQEELASRRMKAEQEAKEKADRDAMELAEKKKQEDENNRRKLEEAEAQKAKHQKEEAEKEYKEKAERAERIAQYKLEKERADREAKEKLENELQEGRKQEDEKAERETAEREQAEREKAEREKAERAERIAKFKAEKERDAKEKAAKEAEIQELRKKALEEDREREEKEKAEAARKQMEADQQTILVDESVSRKRRSTPPSRTKETSDTAPLLGGKGEPTREEAAAASGCCSRCVIL